MILDVNACALLVAGINGVDELQRLASFLTGYFHRRIMQNRLLLSEPRCDLQSK